MMARVADTSYRALTLLSLLAGRRRWTLSELADRLGVSSRTVRRDIETLRLLDFPVATVRGPDGGYQLGSRRTLPPLLFDEDQALAVAVALQTAPTTVFGLGDDAARALETLTQVLPAKVRAVDGVAAGHPTAQLLGLRGASDRLRHPHRDRQRRTAPTASSPTISCAPTRPVRNRSDHDFSAPCRVEPHHLVVWAGRWYLVGFDPADRVWRVLRVDRLHLHRSGGRPFTARDVSGGDVARFVMTTHDRGDTPAAWQCTGTVRMALPPETVARWAPGGSVVEYLDAGHTRLTIGAWSWAGIAGVLATFDADLSEVEPPELVHAFRAMAERWRRLESVPTALAGASRPARTLTEPAAKDGAGDAGARR